ncbi:MAG TPA: protein meaA, partial [Rhodobacteraceae bacterium]|nr:protein meaA [Paracoccaceae bacterium]
MPQKDRPWLFRTYAGHSTASASNTLYRENLAKGQTGLSVAFDLPTQTGYDSDHILARGEVGKVGVPISHLGDMRALFQDIPLGQMNTSMTINATAAWQLALYIAVAEEQGAEVAALKGTVQNDIIKEYLSRGTYIFPPAPSLKLIGDIAEYCYGHLPKWNPMNVCSYHLQEAGATPEQELAFALTTAIAVLDQVRGQVPEADFPAVVARISFFVNAGIRFITEMCKMRAFVDLWDEICLERYGVEDPKQRRFRYGVQVNSLGLTEQQPENNVYRILIEMLAVTLSKKARARAVQLPAWNEALGLPRPWDQQWSLRMQQIMAYETDLLEYDDLFDGNPAVDRKVEALKAQARDEIAQIDKMGGAVAAIEYMKTSLVQANAARLGRIESGDTMVVGVNRFEAGEPSPLTGGDDEIMVVDPKVEQEQIDALNAWREARDGAAANSSLKALREAARNGDNIMPPSIVCAKAGVTTGEWGEAMRGVFGEYRAPTGVSMAMANDTTGLEDVQAQVRAASATLKEPLRFLVGKPGLDGHSNGAEQIAVRARDCGMKVFYEGIRMTPEALV